MKETSDIIIHNIYNNFIYPPLEINHKILRKILLSCTTGIPFYDHHGNIYIQHDVIAMESALGPTFSNFYVAHLENKVFNYIKKTKFFHVMSMISSSSSIAQMNKTINNWASPKKSVLNFTYELIMNNKRPFLDVLIDTNNNTFTPFPYQKHTCINSCTLNYKSECPEHNYGYNYKYNIYRAKHISSSETIFDSDSKTSKKRSLTMTFQTTLLTNE